MADNLRPSVKTENFQPESYCDLLSARHMDTSDFFAQLTHWENDQPEESLERRADEQHSTLPSHPDWPVSGAQLPLSENFQGGIESEPLSRRASGVAVKPEVSLPNRPRASIEDPATFSAMLAAEDTDMSSTAPIPIPAPTAFKPSRAAILAPGFVTGSPPSAAQSYLADDRVRQQRPTRQPPMSLKPLPDPYQIIQPEYVPWDLASQRPGPATMRMAGTSSRHAADAYHDSNIASFSPVDAAQGNDRAAGRGLLRMEAQPGPNLAHFPQFQHFSRQGSDMSSQSRYSTPDPDDGWIFTSTSEPAEYFPSSYGAAGRSYVASPPYPRPHPTSIGSGSGSVPRQQPYAYYRASPDHVALDSDEQPLLPDEAGVHSSRPSRASTPAPAPGFRSATPPVVPPYVHKTSHGARTALPPRASSLGPRHLTAPGPARGRSHSRSGLGPNRGPGSGSRPRAGSALAHRRRRGTPSRSPAPRSRGGSSSRAGSRSRHASAEPDFDPLGIAFSRPGAAHRRVAPKPPPVPSQARADSRGRPARRAHRPAAHDFINFTLEDGDFLMTGVAPSGSKKSRAKRREEERGWRSRAGSEAPLASWSGEEDDGEEELEEDEEDLLDDVGMLC